MKIVAATESAAIAATAANTEIAQLKAELGVAREDLANAQEKLVKLDEMEKLYSETHLKENKERETELLAARNDIADLRATLKVL